MNFKQIKEICFGNNATVLTKMLLLIPIFFLDFSSIKTFPHKVSKQNLFVRGGGGCIIKTLYIY